jgi:flagellar basal-body rod modification protein FlgD
VSTPAIGSTTQSSATTGTQGTTNRATSTRDLGQDAFMRLLTTQLQNQDPTKPQDNGEFIAQLATFSQLEKLTTISVKLDQIGTALGVTLTDPAAGSGATGDTKSATTGSTGDGKSSSTGNTGTTSTTNGGK